MEELVKKFKKCTTLQLFVKIEKAKGDDREAILQVLELRGQDTSNWRSNAEKKSEPSEELPKGVYIEESTALTPDEEEMLRKYEETEKAEEAEKVEETEKSEDTSKIEEVAKTAKAKVNKRSVREKDQKEEEVSDFNFKVGEEVEFTPNKSTDKIKGTVKKIYKCKYTKSVYLVINSNKKNFLKRANAI